MRYAEFNHEVTFTMRCSRCGDVFQQTCGVSWGNASPIPSIPVDWSVLDGDLICTRHTIEVKDTPDYKKKLTSLPKQVKQALQTGDWDCSK